MTNEVKLICITEEIERRKIEADISKTNVIGELAKEFKVGYTTIFRASKNKNKFFVSTDDNKKRALLKRVSHEV